MWTLGPFESVALRKNIGIGWSFVSQSVVRSHEDSVFFENCIVGCVFFLNRSYADGLWCWLTG